MGTAKAMRVVQLTSLAAMIGLMVYGVVDAWMNFKPYEVELKPFKKAPAPAGGLGLPGGSGHTFVLEATWRF